MPTALAPASWASCPTSDPTGPLGAATTTGSPGCGLPMARRPPYAVNPGIPSTPRLVVTGATAGSSLRRPVPSESACVRHPVRARTTSPLTYTELFETSTCATVSPVITSPISSGVAYDFPSFIEPRIYGSREILHPEQKLAGCRGRDRGLFEAEVGELRLPLWSSRENDLSPTRCHDAHLFLVRDSLFATLVRPRHPRTTRFP